MLCSHCLYCFYQNWIRPQLVVLSFASSQNYCAGYKLLQNVTNCDTPCSHANAAHIYDLLILYKMTLIVIHPVVSRRKISYFYTHFELSLYLDLKMAIEAFIMMSK